MGSQVTIVESGTRILSKEDPDASAIVRRALEADGVHILTEHRLTHVSGSSHQGGEVTLEHRGSESVVPYDGLLIAVGRTPRTDGLGLDSAGIALADSASVRVDQTLRTNQYAGVGRRRPDRTPTIHPRSWGARLTRKPSTTL